MNKWVEIGISAVTDFIITAGSGYTVAASAGNIIPSEAQIIVALIAGLMQAARGVQKMMMPPPA